MSDERGAWLSTSRPPRGVQKFLKKKGTAFKNKSLTTSYFSTTLTQNSPPPTQLLTFKTQSRLTDYFKKEADNSKELVKCKTPEKDRLMVEDISLASPAINSNEKNVKFEPTTDVTLVNLQQTLCSSQTKPECQTVYNLTQSVRNNSSLVVFVAKSVETTEDQDSSNNITLNRKRTFPNKEWETKEWDCDTDENIHSNVPRKLLKLKNGLESVRSHDCGSALEDLSDVNIATSCLHLWQHSGVDQNPGTSLSSLKFSDDVSCFTLSDTDDKRLCITEYVFFNTQKQKHFNEMGSLTFTEESTH